MQDAIPLGVEENDLPTLLNNDCSSAQELILDTLYYGYIDYQYDVDWVKWYLATPGKFTATFFVPVGHDYDLEVYSDCNTLECISNNVGKDEECIVDADAGWIYAKLYGFGGDWSDTDRYYITGTLAPYEYEYDLVPGDFTVTPLNPTEEDIIAVRYSATNLGPDDITDPFKYKLYIDDVLYETCLAEGRPAGGTGSCERKGISLSAGTHTLKNIVDADGEIAETNEQNNVKTENLYVSPVNNYDLIPGLFSVIPPNPTDDDVIKIRYQTTNNGSSDITDAFYSRLYIDDVLTSTCMFSTGLPAWSTDDCEASGITLSAGTHILKNVVDVGNDITEKNENNNQKTQSLIVTQAYFHDLLAGDITVEPENPSDQDDLTISYSSYNAGPDGIAGSYTMMMYIDDGEFTFWTCDITGHDALTTRRCLAFPGRLEQGNHDISSFVDFYGEIVETNENNNAGSLDFYISRYNLLIDDFGVTDKGNGSYLIDFEIRNEGPDNIQKHFISKVYLDGNVVNTCERTSLFVGNIAYCDKTVNLADGEHVIRVQIDVDYEIGEVDEGDNEAEETVTVRTTGPDLVVSDLWAWPSNPLPYETFDVTFQVKNLGEDIVQPFNSTLYIDADTYLTCNSSGLRNNSFVTCRRGDLSFPETQFLLTASADDANAIEELDENNNRRSLTLIIGNTTCPVPDGSSRTCDCDYDSDCPFNYPFCEEEYPYPISAGYDACITTEPAYCGDLICNNGETWQTCQSDCTNETGKIVVDVDYLNGNPLPSARVYLENDFFLGTTDYLGKIDFTASYGYRNVRVNCPNGDFCASKSVYLNSPNGYVSVDCNCSSPEDPDLDGFTDYDEYLAGSDPLDPESTPFTTLPQYYSVMNQLVASNEDELLDQYYGPIMGSGSNQGNLSEEFFSTWDPPTVGTYMGFSFGATGALQENVFGFYYLGKAVLDFVLHLDEMQKHWEDMKEELDAIMSLKDPEVRSAIWNGWYKGTLEKAEVMFQLSRLLFFWWQEEDRTVFSGSFVVGWVAGYVTFNVFTIFGKWGTVWGELRIGTKIAQDVNALAQKVAKMRSSLIGISNSMLKAAKVTKIVNVIYKATDTAVDIKIEIPEGVAVVFKNGDDILEEGSKAKALAAWNWQGRLGEDVAEQIHDVVILNSGLSGVKKLSGVEYQVVTESQNYVLAIGQTGKNVKIWRRAEVKIKNGMIIERKAGELAEIDRLYIIDESQPLILEVKTGKSANVASKLSVSEIEDNLRTPLEELYGNKPDYVLYVSKGQKDLSQKSLLDLNNEKWADISEMSITSEEFESYGISLEKSYRNLGGN